MGERPVYRNWNPYGKNPEKTVESAQDVSIASGAAKEALDSLKKNEETGDKVEMVTEENTVTDMVGKMGTVKRRRRVEKGDVPERTDSIH